MCWYSTVTGRVDSQVSRSDSASLDACCFCFSSRIASRFSEGRSSCSCLAHCIMEDSTIPRKISWEICERNLRMQCQPFEPSLNMCSLLLIDLEQVSSIHVPLHAFWIQPRVISSAVRIFCAFDVWSFADLFCGKLLVHSSSIKIYLFIQKGVDKVDCVCLVSFDWVWGQSWARVLGC